MYFGKRKSNKQQECVYVHVSMCVCVWGRRREGKESERLIAEVLLPCLVFIMAISNSQRLSEKQEALDVHFMTRTRRVL